MREKSAIFITGSGKCGSSVVAYSFFSSGFPMGRQEELVIHEGAKGNVRGYWEHSVVQQINEDLLVLNGAAWDKTPNLPLRTDNDLESRMESFARSVPDGFCCKDPRLVWTVDVWARYFTDIVLVIPFRNPAGFVRSIAYKWPEKFSAQSGLGNPDSSELNIWQASNQRLVDLSTFFQSYWISFDDSVPEFEDNLAHIIESLGKSLDRSSFRKFMIPSERRFSSQEDISYSMSAIPAKVRQLYLEMRTRERVCNQIS